MSSPLESADNSKEKTSAVPYHYYEQQIVRRVHHFYLSKTIGAPENYIEMIHRIQMAGSEEVIYIHLNVVGGLLTTGVQIVNAIQDSQAHVICSVESESHSLGTLIFLAADEFIVHDNCMMMFHNFSSGFFGKGHEQLAQVAAMTEWFTKLARKLYVPFLSEEEFQSIIDGKDLWLMSDDIKARLAKQAVPSVKS